MEKWPVLEENGKIAEISEFQLWPKIPLQLVIFPLWNIFEIYKKSLLTWSQKYKGVVSSWEWHAYFS